MKTLEQLQTELAQAREIISDQAELVIFALFAIFMVAFLLLEA